MAPSYGQVTGYVQPYGQSYYSAQHSNGSSQNHSAGFIVEDSQPESHPFSLEKRYPEADNVDATIPETSSQDSEIMHISDLPETQQAHSQQIPSTNPMSPPKANLSSSVSALPNFWATLTSTTKNKDCLDIKLYSKDSMDPHVIGRALFWTDRESYKRKTDTVLKNDKISSLHCKIWREFVSSQVGDSPDAVVKLQDFSSNGTYVSGRKVGKGNITMLHRWDEIRLGPTTDDSPLEDQYSYLFRLVDEVSAPKSLVPFNTTLDAKYELCEQIGKGSFASVYKIVDRTTGRRRAVKIINKARFANNPKTSLMLKREVSIMKDLHHPYIVRYLDGYEDDVHLWLIMELVDGGDLLDFITSKGGLNEEEASEIAMMVCDAIAYLHDKGVAHRDLKPENLLLTSGCNPVCKVADFGLAKISNDKTALRTMCGTPSYLAPEVVLQAPDHPGYSFAVDAWSLGAIIYACLANASAFVEDEKEPLHLRMTQRSPDMSLLQEIGCSKLAIDFVQRFLTVDPTKRMSPLEALQHPWLQPCLARRHTTGRLSSLLLDPPDTGVSVPHTTRAEDSVVLSFQHQVTDCVNSRQAKGSPESEETNYSQHLKQLRLTSDDGVQALAMQSPIGQTNALPQAAPPDLAHILRRRNRSATSPERHLCLSSKKRKPVPSAFSTDSALDISSRDLADISTDSSILSVLDLRNAPYQAATANPSTLATSALESRNSSPLSMLSDCSDHAGSSSGGAEPASNAVPASPLLIGRTPRTHARIKPQYGSRRSGRVSEAHRPIYVESDDDESIELGKDKSIGIRTKKQRRNVDH